MAGSPTLTEATPCPARRLFYTPASLSRTPRGEGQGDDEPQGLAMKRQALRSFASSRET